MGTGLFPFLDAIDVNYGPKIELGRHFLMLAEAGRRLGISWFMGRGFDRLVEVNAAHRDSWAPLAPIYDPQYSDINEDNAIYIEGRHLGQPVVTLALRRFDWPDTSLRDEWESGRFAYKDPAAHMQPGEQWIAAAPIAAEITGRVADSGGVWCRPDFRGRRIPSLIVGLIRSVSVAVWNPDFTIGQIESGALSRTMLALYGYPTTQPGLKIVGSWRSFECVLSYASREELTRWILAQVSAAADKPDQGNGRYKAVAGAGAPR